jgi:hypothetical protein
MRLLPCLTSRKVVVEVLPDWAMEGVGGKLLDFASGSPMG